MNGIRLAQFRIPCPYNTAQALIAMWPNGDGLLQINEHQYEFHDPTKHLYTLDDWQIGERAPQMLDPLLPEAIAWPHRRPYQTFQIRNMLPTRRRRLLYSLAIMAKCPTAAHQGHGGGWIEIDITGAYDDKPATAKLHDGYGDAADELLSVLVNIEQCVGHNWICENRDEYWLAKHYKKIPATSRDYFRTTPPVTPRERTKAAAKLKKYLKEYGIDARPYLGVQL